jgi:glutamate mutase epsilon subunit
MLVFRWKQNTKFPWLALRTKNENTTMAPRKAKKEQAALCRAALENKVAAQHATALQKLSLSGEVLKDVDESMSTKLLEVAADALTTDDDEKASQSKKTSGKSGATKRKASASVSSSKHCTMR